jgi:hypothetical protein
MQLPRVYADFRNADERGRLRLDRPGTREDLARQGLALAEGLPPTSLRRRHSTRWHLG